MECTSTEGKEKKAPREKPEPIDVVRLVGSQSITDMYDYNNAPDLGARHFSCHSRHGRVKRT